MKNRKREILMNYILVKQNMGRAFGIGLLFGCLWLGLSVVPVAAEGGTTPSWVRSGAPGWPGRSRSPHRYPLPPFVVSLPSSRVGYRPASKAAAREPVECKPP